MAFRTFPSHLTLAELSTSKRFLLNIKKKNYHTLHIYFINKNELEKLLKIFSCHEFAAKCTKINNVLIYEWTMFFSTKICFGLLKAFNIIVNVNVLSECLFIGVYGNVGSR